MRQIQAIGDRQAGVIVGSRQADGDLAVVLLTKLPAILPRHTYLLLSHVPQAFAFGTGDSRIELRFEHAAPTGQAGLNAVHVLYTIDVAMADTTTDPRTPHAIAAYQVRVAQLTAAFGPSAFAFSQIRDRGDDRIAIYCLPTRRVLVSLNFEGLMEAYAPNWALADHLPVCPQAQVADRFQVLHGVSGDARGTP